MKIIKILDKAINKLLPHLDHKLAVSRMKEKPKSFLLKSLIGSVIFSIVLTVLVSWLFIIELNSSILVWVCIFLLLLFILLSIPSFNIKKMERDIEGDIFITGRRLLTLLESGESLTTALVNISSTKTKSAKYFSEVASEIELGTTLENALDRGIRLSPSKSFQRILSEIKNSIKTGSGISQNLATTLDDIYKNKIIIIEEYGKKLNPLCMFYMIFGTIVPSIGIVMLILFFSLIQIKVTFVLLMVVLFFVVVIQVLFLVLFSKMRPVVGS